MLRSRPEDMTRLVSCLNTTCFGVIIVLFGLLGACSGETSSTTDEGPLVKFDIPEGFIIERLYRPASMGKGSWVSLAWGPGNLLFAGDQFGAIYGLQMEEKPEGLNVRSADSLQLSLGYAHGLLWHRDTLYISVNRKWEANDETPQGSGRTAPGSGVYKAWDTDGDQLPDSWEELLRLEGYGEHGPHSLVISPDSSEISFVAGNHTLLPPTLEQNSLVPVLWGEDQLLPPYPDPRGHAVDIRAPGGWIASLSLTEAEWTLRSTGYRNPFDLTYWNGELFTYDSDMEWDLGMPWYRPTRICHVTSGSEFGWRTGSGKWLSSFPDNLPGVVSMLQGSPTALLSGSKLALPERYRQGIFAADWSFGTLYYVRLEARGSSYVGQREVFLSGTPLPVADMIAGPDGNMYLVSGGRELESGLYRLRLDPKYQEAPGVASLKRVAANDLNETAQLRKSLESFHRNRAGEKDIEKVWEGLSHPDRHVRFAARIALEHQPAEAWAMKWQHEKRPDALIQAGMALSRLGEASFSRELHRAYRALDWESLSKRQQADLVRALGLAFIRFPELAKTEKELWTSYFEGSFPSGDTDLDMAMGELLIYLNAPGISEILLQQMEKQIPADQSVQDDLLDAATLARSEQYGPTISKMIANRPPRETIHYMKILSRLQSGWTPDQRRRYYQHFYDILASEGGMSFKAYMEQMRVASLQGLSNAEIEEYEALSGVYRPGDLWAELPQPHGPGQQYSADMLTPYVWGDGLKDYTGSPEDGRRAFRAALCISCHRMQGEGGASGPDLSQVGSKFSGYDLINAILSPNDQISDQYANLLLELEDGGKVAGRIKQENDSVVVLMPNPFDPRQVTEVRKDMIVKKGNSPVSPMPPGLLNRLNEQEVMDLLVYLLSNADPEDPLYDP